MYYPDPSKLTVLELQEEVLSLPEMVNPKSTFKEIARSRGDNRDFKILTTGYQNM